MAKKQAVKAVEPEPVPVVDETVYPEPLAVPGDEERVRLVLDGIGHLTDVGTLARVARVVLGRCKACGVRPGVLAGICEDYR